MHVPVHTYVERYKLGKITVGELDKGYTVFVALFKVFLRLKNVLNKKVEWQGGSGKLLTPKSENLEPQNSGFFCCFVLL